MPFDQLEESRFQGEPITTFLFRYGTTPGSYFAYTDAEQAVTDVGIGITYEPIPIMRGNIVSSGTLDKAMLEIRTHQTAPLSEFFKEFPPSQTVTLTIFQAHAGDTDFLVIWTGRVLSCAKEGNEAIFSCEPVSTSLRRPGLRRHYMYGCPHVLYGADCQANKIAATTTTDVFAIQFSSITLRSGWTSENLALYLGGMVEWDAETGVEYRTIMRVQGDTLFLSGPPRFLTIGQTVRVIKGCDHTEAGCTLHNNNPNYGGQLWIPLKNPIGFTNNFY